MGLELRVSLLASLKADGAEAAEHVRSELAALNTYLEAIGLAPHDEPADIEEWSAEMFGYGGLHCLRRIAAYVDADSELPPPGNDDSSEDPQLEAYFATIVTPWRAQLARAFRRAPPFARGFDHLILHSDAEGYYLPRELPSVLFPDDRFAIPGGLVGSSKALLAECERLAAVLEIPPHLTPESDELWAAADAQGEGERRWQRYGIESFTCVALIAGCRRSLATGAALVFS